MIKAINGEYNVYRCIINTILRGVAKYHKGDRVASSSSRYETG